jgi:hypothetical protein
MNNIAEVFRGIGPSMVLTTLALLVDPNISPLISDWFWH